MNYLQLVNDYITETGAGDPIGSITGQTDDYLKATTWISDAWTEIQRNRNWSFRWAEGSFTTSASESKYSLEALGRQLGDNFDLCSFRIQRDDGSTSSLRSIPHQLMRPLQSATSDYPRTISQYPDGSLRVYPTPSKAVVITFEYFKAPVVLKLDQDTPALDPQYHKAIVWKAVEQYAREQGKEWASLNQSAIRSYNSIYSSLLGTETGRVYKSISPFNSPNR